MFERYNQPLLPRRLFLRRLAYHVAAALALLMGSLALGVLGYRTLEGMGWIDAILNASMILGGMGPVDTLHTAAGKLFASAYALFSGVMFLAVAGVVLTPLFHRLLHHFHIDEDPASVGPEDA